MSSSSSCRRAAARSASGARPRWSRASRPRARSYAPLSGEVSDRNAALADDPAKVNADPEGEGWFFKIKLSDAAEVEKLMTRAQYDEFVKGL